MSLTGSRFPCLFVVEKGVKRLFDCLFDLLLVLIVDEWIFGTARILCRAWSMKRYRVRLSVSLSVRLSQHGPHSSSRFAAVGPADRIYRSISAAAAGECGQCHVVSVRMQLNTDLYCVW